MIVTIVEVIKDNRISENDETIVYYNEDYSIKKKKKKESHFVGVVDNWSSGRGKWD